MCIFVKVCRYDVYDEFYSLDLAYIIAQKQLLHWEVDNLRRNLEAISLFYCNLYQSLSGVSLFHSNLQLSVSCSAAISILPIFYQELIQLWCKICDAEPTQPSEILGRSVWNNRFILCKRDPIFYNEFYSKGIRKAWR